jgi:microcystin-dependent protein
MNYLGEIRMFAGNFPPNGWAFCQGQLLPIAEHDALFNLIGTTYGGDGQQTFALPDLRGRVPMHQGAGFVIGETTGAEAVTLNVNNVPAHSHAWGVSSTSADTAKLSNGYLANDPRAGAALSFDNNPQPTRVALPAAMLSPVGASQPHENMAPYLGINFIIALFGIYPNQG